MSGVFLLKITTSPGREKDSVMMLPGDETGTAYLQVWSPPLPQLCSRWSICFLGGLFF